MKILEPKLILCNPHIFFVKDAPPVYSEILNNISVELGVKAIEIQGRYSGAKADTPKFFLEIAELFKGIKNIESACTRYCREYERRETYKVCSYFFESAQEPFKNRCWTVSSLPRQVCSDFTGIGVYSKTTCISSDVCTVYSSRPFDRELHFLDRKKRKDFVLREIKRSFGDLGRVVFIGQSIADISLGKAVQKEGGRFFAFHTKDREVEEATGWFYDEGYSLEEVFRLEDLID